MAGNVGQELLIPTPVRWLGRWGKWVTGSMPPGTGGVVTPYTGLGLSRHQPGDGRPQGVVTPYTGLGLSGNGSRSWRMGARWQVAGNRSVSLEGTRHEAAKDDGAEHGLMLCGAVRW